MDALTSTVTTQASALATLSSTVATLSSTQSTHTSSLATHSAALACDAGAGRRMADDPQPTEAPLPSAHEVVSGYLERNPAALARMDDEQFARVKAHMEALLESSFGQPALA